MEREFFFGFSGKFFEKENFYSEVKKFVPKLFGLTVNQANANVSVVKLGQTEGDAENGDITFTVDPPRTTVASEITTTTTTTSTEGAGLVDPFMEMDPEQLERLETALQSEEAKQILGENVTAMLGNLFLNFNYPGKLI